MQICYSKSIRIVPRNTSHPDGAWVAIQSIFASPAGVRGKMATMYTLPFQPMHPAQVWKVDCDCPEKNTVRFSSIWDFVDENMEATGAGAIFLSSVL